MYYVNPNLVNLHRIVYQNNRKDYLRLDLNENPGGLPQDFIDEVLEGILRNMYLSILKHMNLKVVFLSF